MLETASLEIRQSEIDQMRVPVEIVLAVKPEDGEADMIGESPRR